MGMITAGSSLLAMTLHALLVAARRTDQHLCGSWCSVSQGSFIFSMTG